MKINLKNDPLKKQKFLIKNRDIGNSVINLFGAISDRTLYFRRKSKLNGSAYLVGVNKLIENSLKNVNIKELSNNYNYYLNVDTKPYALKKRINKWIKMKLIIITIK